MVLDHSANRSRSKATPLLLIVTRFGSPYLYIGTDNGGTPPGGWGGLGLAHARECEPSARTAPARLRPRLRGELLPA